MIPNQIQIVEGDVDVEDHVLFLHVYRGSRQMSSRQAQVENDCEEEEDYPQEEQMNAEVSTETSKHFEISTFAVFSSILVSEKSTICSSI